MIRIEMESYNVGFDDGLLMNVHNSSSWHPYSYNAGYIEGDSFRKHAKSPQNWLGVLKAFEAKGIVDFIVWVRFDRPKQMTLSEVVDLVKSFDMLYAPLSIQPANFEAKRV